MKTSSFDVTYLVNQYFRSFCLKETRNTCVLRTLFESNKHKSKLLWFRLFSESITLTESDNCFTQCSGYANEIMKTSIFRLQKLITMNTWLAVSICCGCWQQWRYAVNVYRRCHSTNLKIGSAMCSLLYSLCAYMRIWFRVSKTGNVQAGLWYTTCA